MPAKHVVPCGKSWLVAPGRLQGITLYPADPMRFDTILEILDYKPSYEVIAIACNVGLLDNPTQGGRTCDREARRLLKPRARRPRPIPLWDGRAAERIAAIFARLRG